ncbi:UDP-N-acetylglucosamine 1-carboxyvinyltransferase [bacterium]|nr:UDP-N-acetylglucosamine 1-carboxyvinyltransferase [bacterium]
MKKLIVKGGRTLKGTVTVSSSKNSILPLLAASLLSNGEVTLEALPAIRDVSTMIELLRRFGAKITNEKYSTVKIDPTTAMFVEAPYEIIKTMRASFIVLGPLLAKMGRARVSMPGGCAIGNRPIDLHLEGLKKLGACIDIEEGYILAKASRLRGNKISLNFPSVGATENLMMAASMATGETVIENAAREPEIVDLADFLRKMGADIHGDGSDTLHIIGVDELKPVVFRPIPDRIEAATYIIAGAMAGDTVEVKNIVPDHLEIVLSKLRTAGVQMEVFDNRCIVKGCKRFNAVDFKSTPYPGFPTDLQAQMMILLCLAEGQSVVREEIFENRFMHVAELKRMGADIEIKNRKAVIRGVKKLKGAPVMVSDLRAGAALLLAALVAEGQTVLNRIYHLERGYDNFVDKFIGLGADLKLSNEESLKK